MKTIALSTAALSLALSMSFSAAAQNTPPTQQHRLDHVSDTNARVQPDRSTVEACYRKAGVESPYVNKDKNHAMKKDHTDSKNSSWDTHRENLTATQRTEIDRCFRDKGIHIPRSQTMPAQL